MMQVDLKETRDFLYNLVIKHIPENSNKWYQSVLFKMDKKNFESSFLTSYSMIPRYTGKEKLSITSRDIKQAFSIRQGWNIKELTLDKTARILLILQAYKGNSCDFKNILTKIFTTGDPFELDALFSSLPLLPHPKEFSDLAENGKRTNMNIVFDSIALNNPYPADYFNEDEWNQMILKAVFIERPLYKIYGLDRRVNKKLAAMLVNYTHERWSANRSITPEIWRLISPFADDSILNDIEKLFYLDEVNQLAAALVCSESKLETFNSLVSQTPLEQKIKTENVSWDLIGERWYSTILKNEVCQK